MKILMALTHHNPLGDTHKKSGFSFWARDCDGSAAPPRWQRND